MIEATCKVLHTVEATYCLPIRIEIGGEIGIPAALHCGKYLSDEVADFCHNIFQFNGAILAGAAGGRFVYDLRRRFHLYYKLNPLRSYPELREVCRIKLPVRPVDILVVRETLQGIYQADTVEANTESGREVRHTYWNSEEQVRAVLKKGIEFAQARRKSLTVVGKRGGLPALFSLWSECAIELARSSGVELALLDIDYAAYKMLQEPESFDVVVANNCFGDILSDIGGVLAGSRGLTFGASYSKDGDAVYQTNHGAAYDRADTDTVNPVAQIFSLAMMFRQTFGLPWVAHSIEDAVRAVWGKGWRTADLAESNCQIAGTRKIGELVAREIELAEVEEASAPRYGFSKVAV